MAFPGSPYYPRLPRQVQVHVSLIVTAPFLTSYCFGRARVQVILTETLVNSALFAAPLP